MNTLMTLGNVSVDMGGGDGFIQQLLRFLVVGICVAIVYFMGYWFATRQPVKEKAPFFLTIWNGLFVLVGGIALINFLLGLGGKQFIHW